MNAFRTFIILTSVMTMIFILFAFQAGAVGPKVSEESTTGNKHNLSAKAWSGGSYTGSNPNTYKAIDDPIGNPKGQQICIFCHTPHSANVEGGAPLWNRRFSTETFSRYSSATLQIRLKSLTTTATAEYGSAWLPDGSTKLCLSCHDGSNATDHRLGDVLNGGPIAMTNDVITGIASFNPSNNKMKIGHHPVSFVYNSTIAGAINTGKGISTYVWPIGLAAVKLDKNGKMQCTTCHNAHQNQTDDTKCYDGSNIVVNCTGTFTRKAAPFWVYGASGVAATDRDNVCLACHPLDAGAGFTSPWPTP